MRALKKGQAALWQYQDGAGGEVRLVERAFGIGPSGVGEANENFEAQLTKAADWETGDQAPTASPSLCNSPRWRPRRPILAVIGDQDVAAAANAAGDGLPDAARSDDNRDVGHVRTPLRKMRGDQPSTRSMVLMARRSSMAL